MPMNIKCKKCPAIKGDTFCNMLKGQTWKEDDMCSIGYQLRIQRGIALCSKLFAENEDNPKIEKLTNQMIELSALYEDKFKHNQVRLIDIIKQVEQKPEDDIPFD